MSRTGRAAEANTAPTQSAGTPASAAVYSGTMTRPFRADARDAVGLSPGTRAGRYEIIGRLGAGAMGIVYEARDTELSRTVALKLVRPRGHDSAEAQAALRQEAQAMAQLSHPNVAAVFDIGLVDDQLFIAMELVRGHTLRDLVGADRPWRDLLRLGLAAGRGLAAAHQAGIVHRDFKPDNVLVGTDGSVRVSDFGLARAAAMAEPGDTVGLATHSALLGTPAYMAPETVDGVADALTDQHALAVTMYELIEGERPFPGRSSPAELRASRAPHVPRPWRRRDVTAAVRSAIERGFAADRAARWPSVTALCVAIERAVRSRRRGRTLGTIAGAILVVALIAATRAPSPRAKTAQPAQATRTFTNSPQQQITFSGQASNPSLWGHSRLAYSLGPELRDVVVHDLDTGEVSRVFDPTNLIAFFVKWSHDGTKLLIGSRSGISVVSPNGDLLQRLPRATAAAWSRDDSQVVTTDALARDQLRITDVRTKATIRPPMVLPGAVWQYVFDWSDPDRLLVFTTLQGHGYAVWAVGADGSHPTKLYEDKRSNDVQYPSWVLRGKSIYFERKRDQTTEIVRLPLEGTRRVAEEQVVFSSPTMQGGFAISEDERSLIYARSELSSTVAMVAGGQRTVLLSDTRQKRSLKVSPDGRSFAFIAGVGERAQIVVMPREGGVSKNIAMVEGSPGGLAWSPTSDRLAYTITTPSAVQLWITDLATSASHQVKTSPLSESAHIAWTTHDELLFQLQGNHNYGVIAPGKPERLLFTGSDDDWAFAATPSPDGRHVAVRLNRATSSGMWVISLDDGTAKRVSTDGFLSPRGWTADGNWVLAVDGYFGNVLAVDATGGGRSRVALSPPPYSESIQLLPRDEGFAMIENQWRGDLWMVSLDDRRVAVSPALPPPRPLPLAMPALRNGAMSNGALGAAPTDWIPSGALDETVVTVDGCRGHDDRCVMLGQGGSIDQWIDPKPYLGQRVRLRARGRAETAGRIWVLAQTPSGFAPLASELISTKDWTVLDIAVDIRPDASAMLIRLSSEPTSRAWFDDIAVTPEH